MEGGRGRGRGGAQARGLTAEGGGDDAYPSHGDGVLGQTRDELHVAEGEQVVRVEVASLGDGVRVGDEGEERPRAGEVGELEP
eukprot:1154198-Prymnesium_polylepis.1